MNDAVTAAVPILSAFLLLLREWVILLPGTQFFCLFFFVPCSFHVVQFTYHISEPSCNFSILLYLSSTFYLLISGEGAGTGCKEGYTSYDECGQRCTCVRGKLVNCVRVRKEFTSLTTAERKRHINTILNISRIGSIHRAEYEQLINEHYELFKTSIHQMQHFLPWHRYYILRYENLVRKTDCTFTATFWDWSLDSRHPFSTGPYNIWNSESGFGGDGLDADQNCVLDGPFRKGAWKRVRPDNPDPLPDCLTRDFYGHPPDEIDVTEALEFDNFADFEMTLRVTLHNTVH